MTSQNNNGIFEELLVYRKSYPPNAHTTPLHPNDYANALIQHVSKEVGNRIAQLAMEGRFEDIQKLIEPFLDQKDSLTSYFEMPFKAIHYSYLNRFIPNYSNMFLTAPNLITNYGIGKQNLYKTIKHEMQSADGADFMVSFIRWKGLQLLLQSFDELLKHRKPIRVLTSTYLNYTEPKALQRLFELENVEVKIFNSGNKSFHTKAYLFSRDSKLNTGIIGSSNISRAAFVDGYEWNVKLPDVPHIPVYAQASQLFEEMWSDPKAIPLSKELLEDYKITYEAKKIGEPKRPSFVPINGLGTVAESKTEYGSNQQRKIEPNFMQQEALTSLQHTREEGYQKGVVIAATGTGKTYLSAFDVHSFDPEKLLFLAHRDELLSNAQKTFAEVFGTQDKMGKLTGTDKDWEKAFLFSTVQTMHREETLYQFSRDHFDYIIVDEFHHAHATTYQKILEYFRPKFLLGLTATPERMDGRDVLALCDFNVVYEIRLHKALELELLAPFHYFGLHDPTVDYNEISMQNGYFVEKSLVKALNTNNRVDYIIEMIEKYGYDGDRLISLGFCSSIEHASFMTKEFNKRGYSSTFLTGEDSPKVRQETVARLQNEDDSLQVIFTVDIFNEGIDIPELNLLLFLRPTESATVFIQQLGRGLRKTDSKQFVTILDFIGNYRKSFVVPLALTGQTNHHAFDRDSLRKAIETDFSELPDGCNVELEEISRLQIMDKLDQIRMDSVKMLSDLYMQFRKELGRTPEINDFLYHEQAPSLFYFIRKFGSWVETKEKMNDLNEFDSSLLLNQTKLEFVRSLEKMLPIKWPYEYLILDLALRNDVVDESLVLSELQNRFHIHASAERHSSFIHRAMIRLSDHCGITNKSLIKMRERQFSLDPEKKAFLSEDHYRKYIVERVEFGLTEFRRTHRTELAFNNQHGISLYQNYTRNDLQFLFQSEAKEGSWREGVSRVGDHYLLFINLNKDEDVKDHLRYHDYFIDNQHFHWQSQTSTSHSSPRGKDFINSKERGKHIHLFVRKFEKMYGMSLPFMYLGEVEYVRSHGDKPMNITWRLSAPLPQDIFNDFLIR
ncbi:DUF3427 domain-containing protein [Tumebacillus lipolyticus]|uniref:DUF3427 domain-containing protein n=1 Tax=Tumebacillus lipolyticus TaxID=1280370 RepID=A0ABW4ZU83_9BACL